jgi:hypothetical protein
LKKPAKETTRLFSKTTNKEHFNRTGEKMNYTKELKEIRNTSDNSLTSYVADHILQRNAGDRAGIKSFFKDISYGGCISGMIPELIYYSDTRTFYDQFYHEIEEIREKLESDLGGPLQITGDLKNFYAWLGFEETARKIADQLNFG